MLANQDKVNTFFDIATERFGINFAGRLHSALVKGAITPHIRAEIRKVIACSGNNPVH